MPEYPGVYSPQSRLARLDLMAALFTDPPELGLCSSGFCAEIDV